MRIGPTELVLLLVIVLILFGGRKIPELARGLGEGIRNFKEGMRSEKPGENPTAEKK